MLTSFANDIAAMASDSDKFINHHTRMRRAQKFGDTRPDDGDTGNEDNSSFARSFLSDNSSFGSVF